MTEQRFNAEILEQYGESLLVAMGADHDVAAEVSRHLVGANLSGHDSHGIIRVGHYSEQVDSGQLIAAARPEVVSDSTVAALVDGHRGFGQYTAKYATKIAIDKAKKHGVGAVALRHSMHIGRAGEYAEAALEEGLLAILTVGSGGPGVGGVAIPGTSKRFIGANPWAFAMPGREGGIFIDMATAAVAEGKIRVARDGGRPLPPESIIDRDGKATIDPETFYEGGSILPLGGEVAGHKGYALGLASMLFGGVGMIDDDDPTMIGTQADMGEPGPGRTAGALIIVLDPGVFGRAEGYYEIVDDAVGAIRAIEPRPGRSVLLPGDPERRARLERRAQGIALPATTVNRLNALADRFGVARPTPLDV